jgi:hypothetical protein
MPVEGLQTISSQAFVECVPQTLSELAASIAALPAAELVVNIAKTVPGFNLQVAFTTNHEPLGLLGGFRVGQKYDTQVHRRAGDAN